MVKNLLQKISSSARNLIGTTALSLALVSPTYAETQKIDLGNRDSWNQTYKVEMTRSSAAPMLKQYTETKPIYLLGELDRENQTVTLVYSTINRGEAINRSTPEINTSEARLYFLAPEGAEFETLNQTALTTDGESQERVQLKPTEKTKYAKRIKNFGNNLLTRARAYDPIEATAEQIDTWFGSDQDAPLKDKISIYGLMHWITKDRPEAELKQQNEGMQLYEIQPWNRDAFSFHREIDRAIKVKINLSGCAETTVPIGIYQKVGIKSGEQQGKLEALVKFEMENKNPQNPDKRDYPRLIVYEVSIDSNPPRIDKWSILFINEKTVKGVERDNPTYCDYLNSSVTFKTRKISKNEFELEFEEDRDKAVFHLIMHGKNAKMRVQTEKRTEELEGTVIGPQELIDNILENKPLIETE